MKFLKKVFAWISRVIGWINQSIAAIGIAGGVALAFYNVVARYVFGSSLTWAGELTVYLFLWSAFFGAAYCFKEDAHIAVTILLEKLSPRVAKALMLFSHFVTFIYLAAVSWYGYQYLLLTIDLDERSIDLDIPMWIPYSVIPVSFAFAAWRVAEKFIEIWHTPAEEVVRHSEAEMILAELEEAAPEELVRRVEKKTGGML
ncbi:TRAP transporter small permease [Nitratifractor salsuginis]|uniref:Tripartite ATP-independent periplasmic transporter DctQ component n=1 Tax=Nitratifractor salsuginis (strain DSM 16511 / JCM 12458 / E9I37-1) TaxID=749222 RepID=E6X1C5_NITSE|nr:TRAP transporter small permease [Nitratifractor salsuginis]ADV46987.1 Tripartite ATP-independent periplasmic transporter DctQ component [Nitratifractor salsuginis DSM 16511]